MKSLFITLMILIFSASCLAKESDAYTCDDTIFSRHSGYAEHCRRILNDLPGQIVFPELYAKAGLGPVMPMTTVLFTLILVVGTFVLTVLLRNYLKRKISVKRFYYQCIVLMLVAISALLVAAKCFDSQPRWAYFQVNIPYDKTTQAVLDFADAKCGRIGDIKIPEYLLSPDIIAVDEMLVKAPKGVMSFKAPYFSNISIYKVAKKQKRTLFRGSVIFHQRKIGDKDIIISRYFRLYQNAVKSLKSNERLFLLNTKSQYDYYFTEIKQEQLNRDIAMDLLNNDGRYYYLPCFSTMRDLVANNTNWSTFLVKVSFFPEAHKPVGPMWQIDYYPLKSRKSFAQKIDLPLVPIQKKDKLYPVLVTAEKTIAFKADEQYKLHCIDGISSSINFYWNCNKKNVNNVGAYQVLYRTEKVGEWHDLGTIEYKQAASLNLSELVKAIEHEEIGYVQDFPNKKLDISVTNKRLTHEFKFVKKGDGPDLTVLDITPTLNVQVKDD